MKKLIILFILYSFTTSPEKVLLEKFTINKFQYFIYKESKYLHDDDVNAAFFVVYGKNSKQSFCSAYMSAERNDTIFTKGIYSYTKQKLIFKQYYYFKHRNYADSLINTFVPNKKGTLLLETVTRYKNGKTIIDK